MSQSDPTDEGSPPEERLQAEIERTRAELGSTVEALAARADVKARAQEAAVAARRQLREAAGVAAGQARVQLVEVASTAGAAATRARDRLRGRSGAVTSRIDEVLPAPILRIPASNWLLGAAIALAMIVVVRRRWR